MEFSERLLYHIWDAQHIIKKPNTISGKQILIMYQGQWNTDFGADFHNGIVSIDGEVFRGDIEIHLKTYDWINHKHNEDANYNNTILHVVYEHNGQYPYTITEDGSSVEILELKPYLDQDLAKLIKKFDQSEVHSPDLCTFFAGLDPTVTELILTKLGVMRMEKKVKRYAAELYFSDFNQLLYQGIMEAGGYSKNSYSMLQIALSYPYVDLLEWKHNGMTSDQLLAIWIYGSGLDEHTPKSVPENIQDSWEKLYHKQSFTHKKTLSRWNLFRVRPVNHPVVRMMQIVNIIYHSLDNDLLSLFIKIFSQPVTKDMLKKINRQLLSLFNDENLPQKYHIGANRIDVIMINILLPILILYGDKMSYQTLKERAWEIYKNYAGLPLNHIEKFMKLKYLNDPQQKLISKKAIYQQGLLKLYYEYCRYHNCILCETHKRDLILSM